MGQVKLNGDINLICGREVYSMDAEEICGLSLIYVGTYYTYTISEIWQNCHQT